MTDWIVATQNTLGPLITKPTLKDALLQRPPFRFLHDIVTNLLAATGFPAGLFTPQQLDHTTLTDKDDKMAWWDRLRACVELAVGQTIDSPAFDVVAGKECHKTNYLLQCLAQAATNVAQLDMDAIIAGVNVGAQPGTIRVTKQAAAPASAPVPVAPAPAIPVAPAPVAAPVPAPAPAGASGEFFGPFRVVTTPFPLPPVSGADVYADSIALLSPLCAKPAPVQKYLEKPPFRYIFDMVLAISARTGHAAGLYTGDELVADNFKPGAAGDRAGWLHKLLSYTVAGSGDATLPQLIDARNILAGREAPATNVLLQRFAQVATSGTAPEDVLAVTQGQQLPYGAPPFPQGLYAHHTGATAAAATSAAPVPATAAAPVAAPVHVTVQQQQQPPQQQQQQQQPAAALAPASGSMFGQPLQQQQVLPAAAATPTDGIKVLSSAEPATRTGPGGIVLSASAAATPGAGGGGLGRMTTARRAPPKPVTAAAVGSSAGGAGGLSGPGAAAAAGGALRRGVLRESDAIAEEDGDDEVGTSAGGAGGAQVVTAAMITATANSESGQLVRQIRAAMVEHADGGAAGAGGPRLGRVATGRKTGAVYSAKQSEDLRRAVQRLCTGVLPVGKCAGYVAADLAEMGKELAVWQRQAGEATAQLQEEKKTTEKALGGLHELIAAAEAALEETRGKVWAARAQVLANETEIEALIEQQTRGTA